ncbi:MAG: hypothetical protein PHY80_03820 [Rickettsiales bacterium]|nr:hypothetical protein [Rickettsiales bacterium]
MVDLSKYKVESKEILKKADDVEQNKIVMNVRHKPGRKPAEEPLKKLVSVYFTKEEYKLIEEIADGRPIAGVLRKVIKKYLINNIK